MRQSYLDGEVKEARGTLGSDDFIRRSRNPELEAPKRFVRTVKQPGDLVL